MKIAEPIIAVVGAGRMGTGITQVFAYSGYKVELIDIKERPATKMDKALKSAANEIAVNLSFLSSLNVLQESSINRILGRIGYHYAAQTEEVFKVDKDVKTIFWACLRYHLNTPLCKYLG